MLQNWFVWSSWLCLNISCNLWSRKAVNVRYALVIRPSQVDSLYHAYELVSFLYATCYSNWWLTFSDTKSHLQLKICRFKKQFFGYQNAAMNVENDSVQMNSKLKNNYGDEATMKLAYMACFMWETPKVTSRIMTFTLKVNVNWIHIFKLTKMNCSKFMFYNFAGFMEIGSGWQNLVFDGRADSLFYTKAQNHASLSKLYVQRLKFGQFIKGNKLPHFLHSLLSGTTLMKF